MPLSATVCAALPVMVTAATRLPTAVGLKATEKVQVAPAANLAPHVFACLTKSPLFVPPTAILEIAAAPVPVFETVTDCDALMAPTVVEP